MNAARSYWPVGYDDVESYYYKFEKACGTWGNTGKRQKKKIDGGNSFEPPRSSEFPLTPSHNMVLFETAACNLGYRPFSVPGPHFTVIPRAFKNPNFEARTKSYAMKLGCAHRPPSRATPVRRVGEKAGKKPSSRRITKMAFPGIAGEADLVN